MRNVAVKRRRAAALGYLVCAVAGLFAEPSFGEAARLDGLRDVDPGEVVLFAGADDTWAAYAAGGGVHVRRIPGGTAAPEERMVYAGAGPEASIRLLGAYGTAGRLPWLCFVADAAGGSALWIVPRPHVGDGTARACSVDRDGGTGRIDAYWVYQESRGFATIVYLRESMLHGILVSADGRVHDTHTLSDVGEMVQQLELATTVTGDGVRHEGFYTARLVDGGFVTWALRIERGGVVAREVVAEGTSPPQVRYASFSPVRRGLLVRTEGSLRQLWWDGATLRGARGRRIPTGSTAVSASEGPTGTTVIAAGDERTWVLSDRGDVVELTGRLATQAAWIVPGECVRLVLSRRVSGGRALVLQDVRLREAAVAVAPAVAGPYACVATESFVDAHGGVWVVGVGRYGGEHRLVWSDMAHPGWSRGSPVADESGGEAVAIRWAAAAGGCVLAAVDGGVICADVDTGDTAWYPSQGRVCVWLLRGEAYLTDATSAQIVVLRVREESE
jgi:hypothetical protein